MVATLFRDIRFAIRNLTRTPGFTVVAVATLALGVGANTAIFSVVNGVMLRPLPYHEPNDLVQLERFETSVNSGGNSLSQPDITDIKEAISISASAGYRTASFTLTEGDQPEIVRGGRVTNGLFEVFHVSPTLGRDLRWEENVPGAPLVAIIGHSFWQERYGGDPDIIGKTIDLSEKTYEIVGVAPPGFEYPRRARVWTPIYLNLNGCGRGCQTIQMIARLAPNTTLESARTELLTMSARMQDAYPNSNFGTEFRLHTLAETVYGDVRTGLFVMLGAVGLVLLIACANVANLLLVRATARSGEIAVRSALGAGRGRLVTQLLVEALVLAVSGGILGVLLAKVGLNALLSLAPSNLPRLDEIGLDGTVLLFAFVTVTGITLLFGLMPALRLVKTSVSATLNRIGRGDSGSETRAWSRSALLVAEVALSLMLLVGAGLLLKSFAELNKINLGFDRENVLTFAVSLPDARYNSDQAVSFFEQLEYRLSAIPGVESVGGALGTVLGRNIISGSFRMLDRPAPPPGQGESGLVRAVTLGYLTTLGVPLLQGRGFEPSDRVNTQPVAIVSQQFVDRHYPDKDPLGQQLDIHVGFGYDVDDPYTIVGVVGNVLSLNVREDPFPEIYVTQAQAGTDYFRMLVRTAPGAHDVLPAARQVVSTLDPNIPMRAVETLNATVDRAYGPARFYMILLSVFAGVAVLLAAIGLYGVVAYTVSRRTREIGIRIALGAESGSVVRLVLRQGLAPVGLGIALGLLGAWGGSRVLASLLYNVEPQDPFTLAGVTALLLGVVAVAMLIPARRASRIHPVAALKGE